MTLEDSVLGYPVSPDSPGSSDCSWISLLLSTTVGHLPRRQRRVCCGHSFVLHWRSVLTWTAVCLQFVTEHWRMETISAPVLECSSTCGVLQYLWSVNVFAGRRVTLVTRCYSSAEVTRQYRGVQWSWILTWNGWVTSVSCICKLMLIILFMDIVSLFLQLDRS